MVLIWEVSILNPLSIISFQSRGVLSPVETPVSKRIVPHIGITTNCWEDRKEVITLLFDLIHFDMWDNGTIVGDKYPNYLFHSPSSRKIGKIFIWVTNNYWMNRGMIHPIKDGWCFPVCSRDVLMRLAENTVNNLSTIICPSVEYLPILLLLMVERRICTFLSFDIFCYPRRSYLKWKCEYFHPWPN
jgi:hypothetical protein